MPISSSTARTSDKCSSGCSSNTNLLGGRRSFLHRVTIWSLTDTGAMNVHPHPAAESQLMAQPVKTLLGSQEPLLNFI